MNFIFFSISNDYQTFHRKREIEAIADLVSKNDGGVIYFQPPVFFLKKLILIIKRLFKNKISHKNSVKICGLYTLLPLGLVNNNNFAMNIFVTLPIRLQIKLAKNRFLTNKETLNWFYKPDQYLLYKDLGPYIYLHYDNYSGDKNYKFSLDKRFEYTLMECIKNSLVTLVASSKLFLKYKDICQDKVIYYPNAISRSLLGDELFEQENNSKIIGFIGQIDSSFDNVLIEKISDKYRDFTIYLIGPVKNDRVNDLVESKNNIISTGYIEYEELSNLIKKFDIGICPYKKSEFNQYRNPLKITEYFSYGIPIVSVACDIDPKIVDLVGVAYSDDEFIDLIDKELKSNNLEKVNQRKSYAEENCWDNRATLVLNKIIELNITR